MTEPPRLRLVNDDDDIDPSQAVVFDERIDPNAPAKVDKVLAGVALVLFLTAMAVWRGILR